MRSLSVVCTPIQLVNCIEAIYSYKSNVNDLLVLASVNRVDKINRLIEEYLPYFCFNSIMRLNPSTHSSIMAIKEFMLLRRAATNNCYDILFVSNYKQARQKYLQKKLFEKNSNVNFVLIDDGLAVCEIVDRRNNEIKSQKANVHYSTRINRLLYKRKVNNFIPQRLEYFTVYNDLDVHNSDRIVINGYLFIKSNSLGVAPNIKFDNSLIFLGQPLVDSCGKIGLNKEKYSNYIINALKDLGMSDYTVYYFPHPVENINTTLNEELRSKFLIQASNIPFEVISLKLDNRIPILGFYTSALVNLRKSYKDRKIVAIYFDDINNSRYARLKKVVNEAYDYMKSINITILNR